jgi:hypothetical protein
LRNDDELTSRAILGWCYTDDEFTALTESIEQGEFEMGSIKRAPAISENIIWRALDIPKSEYIEICLDFLKESYGEDKSEEELMELIEQRRLLLFGKAPKKRAPREQQWFEK